MEPAEGESASEDEERKASCHRCDASAVRYSPTGVTISEAALQRMVDKKEVSKYAFQTRNLELMESQWLERERCIEAYHEQRHSLNVEFLNHMIEKMTKSLAPKYPCDFGRDLIKCYEEQCKSPLGCEKEVREFEECVAEAREKIAIRNAARTPSKDSTAF